MGLSVNILSITGQTPYDIYVCDADGNNCFYIDRITGTTYTFDILEPNDNYNRYMLKIVDGNSNVITGTTNVV